MCECERIQARRRHHPLQPCLAGVTAARATDVAVPAYASVRSPPFIPLASKIPQGMTSMLEMGCELAADSPPQECPDPIEPSTMPGQLFGRVALPIQSCQRRRQMGTRSSIP